MKINVDWNVCPPEVLCFIFKYLDTRALTICMLVSNKWKDVAEHTIEHYKMWDDVVSNELINKGTTFINKSNLDSKNIYKNSMLWHHVKVTDISHVKTYEKVQDIKKMNVYKDYLILINGSYVVYYDIKTFSFIRALKSESKMQCKGLIWFSCMSDLVIMFLEEIHDEGLNFEENDYMIVNLLQQDRMTQKLRFYIKCTTDHFEMDPSCWHTLNDVSLYRLENKCCYVYISSKLWVITHEVSSYDFKFVGRHYGSDYDPVTAIHVWNEHVYMVCKWGNVWFADIRSVSFCKAYSLQLPHNISHHNWVMFDIFSCVFAVNANQNERVKVHYDRSSDAMSLECSELTCALQHGDVLFLGFKDGRVEIRIPKNNIDSTDDPERYFNIQQFHPNLVDPTIVGLNVCETFNSHILLVSTSAHVSQLLLTYPDSLLT